MSTTGHTSQTLTLERVLLAQREILHQIAPDDSRRFVFQKLLAVACERLQFDFGVAWGPSEDSSAFSCAAVWQKPGAVFAQLNAATVGARMRAGEGLAGVVWSSGKAEATGSPGKGLGANRASLFTRAGLVAGVGFPIRYKESFEGVVELFSTRPIALDEPLLDAFGELGEQLARSLDHARALELIQTRERDRWDLFGLEEAFAALDDGVVIQDASGFVVACNQSLARVIGSLSIDELTGGSPPRPGFSLTYEDGRPVTQQDAPTARALREGRPVRGDLVRVDAPSGDSRWISISAQPLFREEDPAPHGVVSSFSDISDWRRAERELREQRDRAQTYLELAGTMIVVLDEAERVTLVNPKACAVLGYEEAELVGRPFLDIVIPEDDREGMRSAFQRLRGGELQDTEYIEGKVVTREGNERLIAWHNVVVPSENGGGAATLSAGEDITERRKSEQISHLAYHDGLTGLPNRALLNEHLTMALGRARRSGLAVVMLSFDLNDFKRVNDSLGHAAGDEVLRHVATRLRDSTPASDLLARQGGDEFILLLSDVDSDARAAAEEAALGILTALEAPVAVAGAEFHVGASIGISIFPNDAGDADSLLNHADTAMYQAKTAGRSGFAVYTRGDQDPLEPLSMTTRLRKTLARGGFELRYQPIVRLSDRRPVGVEALIRWRDPERGLVLPGEFIPIAEDTGLIEPIGAWVIDEILQQAHDWREEGLTPDISFNVSPRQLYHGGDIAAMIAEKLERYELDPAQLTVEITETAMMRRLERMEPRFEDLSALGLALAIDDFGAGYSSLSRLLDIPVQSLKIDRSFLARVPLDPHAGAIVKAIIELGRGLGVSIVAEGVENEAQFEFLVEHGCPLAQGFHLGRPLTAEAVTPLLRSGRLEDAVVDLQEVAFAREQHEAEPEPEPQPDERRPGLPSVADGR
jgi:diguanylate cyclase (GGDEF)-like protein/PAS domain S-box-containing protein